MIARASGALLFAYVVIAVAGVVFILFPSETLSTVTAYDATVVIWGLFYVVGGSFAATCLVARRFVTNTVPLWYFEVAGIALIIAANLVYAYAIAQTAIQFGESNILAAAFIVLAFAGGLVARSIETLRLVKTLKQYSNDERI